MFFWSMRQSTPDPGLICNDDVFLKRITTNNEVDSDRTDDDYMFKDLKTKTKHFVFIFCIQYSLVFAPIY